MLQEMFDKLPRTAFEQPEVPEAGGIFAVLDGKGRVLYLGESDNMAQGLAEAKEAFRETLAALEAKEVRYLMLDPSQREVYYTAAVGALRPIISEGTRR